jgi:hypothetical protein
MANQAHHIVVHDPAGECWQGGLVNHQQNEVLKARGVVTLPVEPILLRKSGVGGFSFRAWGSGFPLDPVKNGNSCPLTIFATKEFKLATWRARLVADANFIEAFREGKVTVEGALRLVPDGTQHTPFTPGVSQNDAVDMRKLPMPDENDGWTVGGQAVVVIPNDGHYAFGLYGMAPGLRVAWAAMTVSALQ